MNDKPFEIADEIRHLSPDEIEEMYLRYLSGEKNSSLILEYKIDVKPSKLITVFPPIVHKDVFCPLCTTNMIQARQTKSASTWNYRPLECLTCDHKIYGDDRKCTCSPCITIQLHEKQKNRERKAAGVKEKYNLSNTIPIRFEQLSLFNKVILLAKFLQRYDHINFKDDGPLVPTIKMEENCTKDLYESRILVINPNSDIDGFNGNLEPISLNVVNLLLNVTIDGVDRASLGEIYEKINQELASSRDKQELEKEVFDLLFLIPREDILKYIHLKSNELNVNFIAEVKTREVVTQLLENFSASQIYYFARLSVENAHLFYAKGNAKSKAHAANTIPSKMLSLGEKALNDNWEVYKNKRDDLAPRSYLNKAFYDKFLLDTHADFYKSPGVYWRESLGAKYRAANNSNISCSQCSSKDMGICLEAGILEVACKDCGYRENYSKLN